MELNKIKGISDKREADFNKLGITDTKDLVRFFPRCYLDLRQIVRLRECYNNDFVLTTGKIINIPDSYASYSRKKVVRVFCVQNGETFTAIWFNQPYVLSKLKIDEEYLFYGRIQNKFGGINIVNPSFEPFDKNYRLKGIVPQYSLKSSLNQKIVRSSVNIALSLENIESIIPYNLQVKYNLKNLKEAYKKVHNPESFIEKNDASERIAVEEYFALISAFKFIKGDKEQIRINKYNCTDSELVEFINRFGFVFTSGQKQVVNEIFNDMNSNKVMNRLVEGDVGSGKTAVALSAMFVAVKSGFQAVMLAPTEVLARQNYSVIKKYFYDYNVEILTGSNTQKEKKDIKSRLSQGEIHILVGTHAVIQDDVVFKNLAFCVCDEQHRFGVAQRSSLTGKGVLPDVLVMSATPIPRTLSLIFYGDLDVSLITDKPKNRLEIQTNLVPSFKYEDMIKFIRNEISKGRQAYFVCPKIEGDDEGTIMSVTELFEDLKVKLFGIEIGLLHGKLKDKDKNELMRKFKDKEIKALVSTTVIEVGVDVPNASIMVIYNAERFGLSQLHQLRGRVGRSDIKSYCFLLSDTTNENSIERLKILKSTNDGFKIADYDFESRGSGDFFGLRQSGKFINDLGNLIYSTASIFLAKKIADEAFMNNQNLPLIKDVAMKKYERLKNITLN